MITIYSRETDLGRTPSSQLLRYHKGTAIYFEGDPSTHWFEVLSGIVRTCRFHADGHRQLTGFFYSGDAFGVEEGAFKESAEAVTSVALRRHSRSDGPVPDDNGHDGRAEAALRRALDNAQQCIFLLGHRTAAERVAAFLLNMTQRLELEDGVPLPMSRTDIADHLGLTIHTVSRTISELGRRRLIALEGPSRFHVLDPAGLRALAGEAEADWPEPVAMNTLQVAAISRDRI